MSSMDVFGKALNDYYNGEFQGNFYIVNQYGEKFPQDISWYFRNNKEDFENTEQAIFDNIDGQNILDIGCANAYYFPFLKKNGGNITGIDISENAIETAHKMGHTNTYTFDILDEDINNLEKYDNIVLMGNNISLGGDIEGTKKLINRLHYLLKDNGTIFAILNKEDEEYLSLTLYFEYNDSKSGYFKWMRMRLDFLESLLKELNFNLEVISENNYGYCTKITKQ